MKLARLSQGFLGRRFGTGHVWVQGLGFGVLGGSSVGLFIFVFCEFGIGAHSPDLRAFSR